MIIKQITHIVLASLLLVSLTGLSVKKHFCLGSFAYATFSFVGESCMEEEMDMELPCCQDEHHHFQVVDDFQPAPSLLVWEIQLMQSVLASESENHISTSLKLPVPKFYQYRPPLLRHNIPVLIQAFLI